MEYALIFVLLLTFVLGLGLIARRLQVPYPILFVIGGLLIGFVPILPQRLDLNPQLVFFLILPPLLYIQAFYTSWRDFRAQLRTISMLAIGLVFATTITVALVAHWLIPDFSLAEGFVLGAIISPPDAVAASAIAQRLGLPRKVVTILEGESLVNDATSLVLFKVSLAAIGATVPLLGGVWIPGEFLYIAAGGVVVGLVMGWFIGWMRRRLSSEEPQIFLTISLLTPYISYLFADQFLHVSGILAAVSTGLYLGWLAPETTSSALRLQVQPFWQLVVYLLNGIVFVLIGLQLPHILQSMREPWWPRPFLYAVVINIVCIVVRLAWVFPGAYLPRLIKPIRDMERAPDWREVAIVGWSGMRGIVSLAAALTLQGYPNFPRPHLIQFLAFSVIFTTLVFQGLTLPALIRWLGVGDDGSARHEEISARIRMTQAVMEKITEMRQEEKFPEPVVTEIENFFRDRALLLKDEMVQQAGWSDRLDYLLNLRRLRRLMVATQRRALVAMRRHGEIGDDVLHKLEHELDLDEARL